MTHKRLSPQGLSMGGNAAKLAKLGRARLADLGLDQVSAPRLKADMCSSCACRPGTVPNGCLQTQMDFLKSAHEGKPFFCHAPRDGRICAGWIYARAEIVANPLPPEAVALLDRWEYTPADDDRT